MISRDQEIDAAVKRANVAPLPKRFYKAAAAIAHANGFAVLLDGKSVKTPGKAALVAPRRDIAEAMADEWSAQGEFIDPKLMPLTRLVNSAIDGVAGKEAEVAADAAKFAGSDLLCYRAEFPEALVALQEKHWNPVLTWAAATFGVVFKTSVGVVHVAQPAETVPKITAALAGLRSFELAGAHSMTTLMGSVLLALAVQRGKLDASAAWTTAHVDEDFQISHWGEDFEARARREFRWRDMQAAALLALA